jgi:hypothetical protein
LHDNPYPNIHAEPSSPPSYPLSIFIVISPSRRCKPRVRR